MSEASFADQGLESLRAWFLYDRSLEHNNKVFRCDLCLELLNQSVSLLGGSDESSTVLGRVYRLWSGAGHPLESCVNCKGCLFEIQECISTSRLGRLSVDYALVCGPGHTALQLHRPGLACEICDEWLERREVAVRVLLANGEAVSEVLAPIEYAYPLDF